MGTKCRIAMQLKDSVEYIDCYNDGSYDRVGKLLNDVYKNYKYIQMIMNRGDIYLLGSNLKTFSKKDNTNGTIDYRQLCKAKNVECEKELTKARKCNNISDLMTESDCDYIYYFNQKKWLGLKVEENKPYLSKLQPLNKVIANA